MTCESWQDLILDREYLDDVQRQDLDQHLSNCINCKIWANSLAEVDANAKDQLQAEVNPLALGARVLHALARQRRQNWMAAVPDLLDALGWSAVGFLGMVGLLLWTNRAGWPGNYLVWMGRATLVGSVAWAAAVLWREESQPGLLH